MTDLVAAYLSGLSVVAVAKAAGVSAYAVDKALAAAGVSKRPRRAPRPHKRDPGVASRNAAIIAAHRAGASIRGLAKRYGLTRVMLQRIVWRGW